MSFPQDKTQVSLLHYALITPSPNMFPIHVLCTNTKDSELDNTHTTAQPLSFLPTKVTTKQATQKYNEHEVTHVAPLSRTFSVLHLWTRHPCLWGLLPQHNNPVIYLLPTLFISKPVWAPLPCNLPLGHMSFLPF